MWQTREEYYHEVDEEIRREVALEDRVRRMVRYNHFESRSKGRGRKRRRVTEVRLVSYANGAFHMWHKFPFDEYATEILGDVENAEEKLIDRISAME